MTTPGNPNIPPTNQSKFGNLASTLHPGNLRDIGLAAYHGFRASKLDTDNSQAISEADHDARFYGDHAANLDDVFSQDYDGRNIFDPPLEVGILSKQAESQARINAYKANPGQSRITSNLRPSPPGPGGVVTGSVPSQPGQLPPRNDKQREEEVELASLVRKVRGERGDQIERSKLYGSTTTHSGIRTFFAKRRLRQETKRDFKAGVVTEFDPNTGQIVQRPFTAYDVLDREAERKAMSVGVTPLPIRRVERNLKVATEGARVTRSPAEKLRAKSTKAAEKAKELRQEEIDRNKKRDEHRQARADAWARQAARRR